MKSRFKNLAEPMIMNEHDAILFSGRNVCLFCEGTLQPKYVAYDTFQIECVRCKAVLKEGENIKKDSLSELEQIRIRGQSEMRDPPKITKEQAIKDLGFE